MGRCDSAWDTGSFIIQRLIISCCCFWRFHTHAKTAGKILLTHKADCSPISSSAPVAQFATRVLGSSFYTIKLPFAALLSLLCSGVHLPTHRPPRPSPVCCGASLVSRPGLAVPSCTARQHRPWSG